MFFGEDEAGIDELWGVPFLDALPGILAQVDREQESAPFWPLLPGMKGMRSQSEEGPTGTTVISYTYDPLNRLTAADYSTGAYFHYTYDAVGNRLSKETYGGLVTTYAFDAANRLSIVDDAISGPQEYSWDDNGNLLSDGVSTYGYNKADRLASVTSSEYSVSYGYNGRGDRMQQTVDGVTTGYTLDIAAGLTQVLVDNSQTYFYGVGRIGQQGDGGPAYFLADALGSVRQLVDGGGGVTLAKDYRPYGEVGGSWGDGSSVFGFAGEATDTTGLIFLRARYYSPAQGRFISRDTWAGDYRMPISYNRWAYSFANPINYTDPSGQCIFGLDTLVCIAIAGALGGVLGGMAYHGYEVLISEDPCASWDWNSALFWGSTGAIMGIPLGLGIGLVGFNYLGWWGAADAAGAATTIACADDGCTGEVRAASTVANQLSQAVQGGSQAVRNGIGQGYNSFRAFKYHEGVASSGKDWHHVVEQTSANVARFGNRMLQNTNNLIQLPRGAGQLHNRISGYYSSIQPLVTGSTELRVRQWLSTKSFDFQWQFGIDLIIRFGGEQYIIDQLGGK